jgi:hypothetical protein
MPLRRPCFVGHPFELSPRHPQPLKVVLDCGRALVAECEVPLLGTTLIRIALDGYVQRMIGNPGPGPK